MQEAIQGEQVASIVYWFGPFRDKSSIPSDIQKKCWKHGVYLIIGRHKPFFLFDKYLQYIGESSNLAVRLSDTHDKLRRVSAVGLQVWVGIVQTDLIRKSPDDDDLPRQYQQIVETESALIHFMPTRLNIDRKRHPPSMPVLIRSYWKTKDGNALSKRPHPAWPDLIEYHPENGGRLVWLGNRPRVKRISSGKSKKILGSLPLSRYKPVKEAVKFVYGPRKVPRTFKKPKNDQETHLA